MSLTRPTRCFERQATAVYLFMGFFGLGVLAFEVGEGHVQRFVTQPDADNVYSTAWGNFSVADDPFSAAAGHVTWLKPCRPLPSKCPLTTDSVAHLFIDSFLLDGLFYLRHIRAFSGSLIKRQVPRRFRLTGGIDLREPGSKGEGPAPQAFLRDRTRRSFGSFPPRCRI